MIEQVHNKLITLAERDPRFDGMNISQISDAVHARGPDYTDRTINPTKDLLEVAVGIPLIVGAAPLSLVTGIASAYSTRRFPVFVQKRGAIQEGEKQTLAIKWRTLVEDSEITQGADDNRVPNVLMEIARAIAADELPGLSQAFEGNMTSLGYALGKMIMKANSGNTPQMPEGLLGLVGPRLRLVYDMTRMEAADPVKYAYWHRYASADADKMRGAVFSRAANAGHELGGHNDILTMDLDNEYTEIASVKEDLAIIAGSVPALSKGIRRVVKNRLAARVNN